MPAFRRARAAWTRHAGFLATASYLVLGVLGTLMVSGAVSEELPGWAPFWTSTVGLVLTGLLVQRRRWPVLVAAACVVSALVAWGYAVAWLALFALAIRRRDKVLVALAAAAWLGSLVSSGAMGVPFVPALFLATSMYGFSIAGGAYLGGRRDLLAGLRERAERAEAEQLLRSNQARLAERSRIAQEMHDVLAHKISLVTLQAGGLEVSPAAGPDEVERVAGLIRVTAREALEDLRGVLGVLRGGEGTSNAAGLAGTGAELPGGLVGASDLRPQPGLGDVRALIDSSRSAGVPITLDWHVPDGVPVPELLGRTAFRVVQEALTNVHKHAHGVSATVMVRGRPGERLDIEVANLRPVGTDVEPLLPGTGTGLEGLAERVRLAGGQVHAGPSRDGFVVRAWLPWTASQYVRAMEVAR